MHGSDVSDDTAVRREHFSTDGPLELDLSISMGQVTVHLDERPGDVGEHTADPDTASSPFEATVEVRQAPSAAAPWADGVHAVLNWVGTHVNEQLGSELRASPRDALNRVRIERVGDRIVVTGPSEMPARTVPLAVTVRAPANSDVHSRNGTAHVTVTGIAARANVSTGSGDVRLDRVTTTGRLRTGSGRVTARGASGELDVKTSGGSAEVHELACPANLVTGTGAVWVGELAGELTGRTGSGNITVAEARSGSAELTTGTGDIRAGVGPSTLARVDVSSGSGRVLNEPAFSAEPPDRQADVTIRARTGTGNVFLTKPGR